MRSNDPAVSVAGVDKAFHVHVGSREELVVALQDVSFTARSGEIVALIGHSGCGKTTLLRIIMGLEVADAGSVTVGGRAVDGPGRDRGMIFQHAELLPWRTALGNVEFGLQVKGLTARERRERAHRYLELVGLGDATQRRPDQLSGGMQQRVGIARALAIDPEVLLMDEPFGSLDAQTRETLQGELLSIHELSQKTAVFVTHDLDEAVLLADRVVVMHAHPGRVRETVEVPIPRPRHNLMEIRSSSDFIDTRYRIWKLLQSDEPGAETRTLTEA